MIRRRAARLHMRAYRYGTAEGRRPALDLLTAASLGLAIDVDDHEGDRLINVIAQQRAAWLLGRTKT